MGRCKAGGRDPEPAQEPAEREYEENVEMLEREEEAGGKLGPQSRGGERTQSSCRP